MHFPTFSGLPRAGAALVAAIALSMTGVIAYASDTEQAAELLGLSDEDLKTGVPLALAGGYRQSLFDEVLTKPTRRSVETLAWFCHKVGAPPVLTAGQIRGDMSLLRNYGFNETEEELAAFASEASESVNYVSVDGGKTGYTVLAQGNLPSGKPVPFRKLAAGGAHPSVDTTACGHFSQIGKLGSGIQRAVRAKTGWTWTTKAGPVVRFLPVQAALVYDTPSSEDAVRIHAELLAALQGDLGVRAWTETYTAVTRQDWTPNKRILKLTTFESVTRLQFIVASTRDPESGSYKVVLLEQTPSK